MVDQTRANPASRPRLLELFCPAPVCYLKPARLAPSLDRSCTTPSDHGIETPSTSASTSAGVRASCIPGAAASVSRSRQASPNLHCFTPSASPETGVEAILGGFEKSFHPVDVLLLHHHGGVHFIIAGSNQAGAAKLFAKKELCCSGKKVAVEQVVPQVHHVSVLRLPPTSNMRSSYKFSARTGNGSTFSM